MIEMTEDIVKKILVAINMIKTGMSSKIEGVGWKVYKVGQITRVDIE